MIGNTNKCIEFLSSQNKDIIFEVKEYRQKRSLNANNYAWCIIGKIADVLRISKDEVYLKMLKNYGQSEIISVLSNIDLQGYFKYFEKIGTAFLQDKEFTHYKIYKGSSEYDSREMAILIDGIVFEAKELDIEVLSDEELNRLKQMWKG